MVHGRAPQQPEGPRGVGHVLPQAGGSPTTPNPAAHPARFPAAGTMEPVPGGALGLGSFLSLRLQRGDPGARRREGPRGGKAGSGVGERVERAVMKCN